MRESDYINFENANAQTNFPYFVLDEKMEKQLPLPIRFHVMHWHEDLQFTYVLSGSIDFYTLESSCVLSAGEGVFINQNVVHQINPSDGGHYQTFRVPKHMMEFYPGSPTVKYVERIAGNVQFPTCLFTRGKSWCNEILSILQSLSDLETNKTSYYEYEVMTLLVHLWLLLMKNIEATEVNPVTNITLRMKVFLDYIEQHYSEEMSLEELAKSASVSKSECLRCFNQTLQTTPYKYLVEYRLARAEQLLLDNSLSIGEIAEQVGFHQVSYFGKCFREKTGYSPREYRKLHK